MILHDSWLIGGGGGGGGGGCSEGFPPPLGVGVSKKNNYVPTLQMDAHEGLDPSAGLQQRGRGRASPL